jgi:pyruvate/2-oxoglutarate dehydrogenase complex dihydrolipoamide acyltransferase (E2) component
MLIQFAQAHTYRGPTNATKTGRHAPIARKKYYAGDIVDVPARYFERHLESEGFAHVYNVAAVAESTSAALMADMSIEQVRELVAKHDLEVTGTGPEGRATKDDMARALEAHYRAEGATLADEQAAQIPDDDALEDLRLAELEKLAELAGLTDVEATGRGGRILRADYIAALSAKRDDEEEDEDEED